MGSLLDKIMNDNKDWMQTIKYLSRLHRVSLFSPCIHSSTWLVFIVLGIRGEDRISVLIVVKMYCSHLILNYIWIPPCLKKWWIRLGSWHSVQFSSVAQLCPTLCDPINRSTPGLPVHHNLPEFTQTDVHRVGDAIQPSHPLSSPSPSAPNPSQHQSLFRWVNSSHEVAKVLELQLQHHSFQRNPRVLTLRPFKFGTGTDKCVQIRMMLGLRGEF